MRLSLIAAAMMAAALSACTTNETPPVADATPPVPASREAFVAAGAQAFWWPDRIAGDQVAITVPNGGVIRYFADGRKTWTAPNGNVVKRRWERRADGVVCQELIGDGREVCGDPAQATKYALDGQLVEFNRETGAPRGTITQTSPGTYVMANI